MLRCSPVVVLGLAWLSFASAKLGAAKSFSKVASFAEFDESKQAVTSVNVIGQLASSGGLQATLQLVGMFALWYAFNAGYNVFNAFMKRDFHFPWTTAAVQLLIGLGYAVPLWLVGARKVPNISKGDLITLLPIAFLNALGHTSTVIATFEKGGGSFTHVIKAAEPVVSVFLGLIVSGIVPKPLTSISLLPVTYGVAYASTLGNLNAKTMSSELTTKAAKLAMTSNFAFAMRSILRKNLPSEFKARTNLDPSNEFAVTTILSLLIILPFALYFEVNWLHTDSIYSYVLTVCVCRVLERLCD
jgi:solute carrier family 35 protein E1